MLKPWHFLLAAFFLAAGYGAPLWWLASQLNFPQDVHSQYAKPTATNHGEAARKIPSTKEYAASTPEEKADENERRRIEKVIIDEKLAFETQRIADYTNWLGTFTFALCFIAVVQAGLFVWQLMLIQAEFKLAHRPKIRLKHLLLLKDLKPGIIKTELWLVNYGGSNASIREIGATFEVAAAKETILPFNPKISSYS